METPNHKTTGKTVERTTGRMAGKTTGRTGENTNGQTAGRTTGRGRPP